ncbi:MAG: ATPase [Prevotella sp.]|nr:ATPase [Prevotella sp.]
MILIADSGSTKTDWCLKEGELVVRKTTQGINPVHQDEKAIKWIIKEELISQSPELVSGQIENVYFYGAGCAGKSAELVSSVLKSAIRLRHLEVNSDLLAAARALCGREEGIASILGTGSNSCFYNGNQIVMAVPPLGYILGDEGSGAVLGKIFLNRLFKGDLSEDICSLYLKESGLTYQNIIDKVYRQPLANRFLATISTFIGRHRKIYPELRNLVVENFRSFFRVNVAKYHRADLSVGAIGSVAFHYQEELREAARLEGFKVGEIQKSPMEGLLQYHSLT